MRLLTAKSQLTLGLICMQVSVLCGAMLFGLVPERRSAVMEGRADLCESIAVVSSQMIAKGQEEDLSVILHQLVTRHPQILSAGVRTADGMLIEEVGEHQLHWNQQGDRSTENEVLVPIQTAEAEAAVSVASVRRWGNVELRFASFDHSGPASFLLHPWVLMTCFISAASSVLFYFYLRRMLKHLDPTNAVPRRVRAALDSLAEGLLVLDRNEQIVLANSAFSDWVGVDPDKLTGTSVGAFRWVTHSSAAGRTGCPWTDALQNETAQAGVMIGLSQDGQPQRNLMANASPVLGYDGKYGGVLVSFDDVTQLEETRRDLKAAKEVAEESRQLAEQASQAKTDFLARMSHEIRTPMNAILGYTEVLRNGFDEKREDRMNYLETIHASGEHLLSLINDILDLSKIESGHMELNTDRHSLRDLISQVLSVMSVKAVEKGIALNLKSDGLIPESIMTDAVRFRQTLFNLVGNAIKFTEEGSVSMVVTHRDGLLQIDVVDTGVGIAEDAVDKVFERFTQADSSITGRFGGTGLGLSISKRLARLMGGDVTVTSVLGQGSTFTLTVDPGGLDGIPLIDPASDQFAGARRSADSSHLKLPPCRILIVDDEAANRQLAGIYIEQAGAAFETACDGREGLELAAAQSFDAILMDFNMPVMGGPEATRRLRETGCMTPIIALTANVMQDDEESARAAGCDGFLRKPIRMAELINGLNALVGDRNKSSVTVPRESASTAPISIECPEPDAAHTSSKSCGHGVAEEVAMEFGCPVSESDQSPLESSLPMEVPEFREIVAEFVPRLHDRTQEMRKAVAEADLPLLADVAHWMAGSAGTVGFGDLTEPARELQAAAKAGDLERSRVTMIRVEALVRRITVPPPAPAELTVG